MLVKKINGELFRSLVINGCENLKVNYAYVDSLNVFPVPDGDTGTNMKLTIEGGAKEVINFHEDNIYEMSKKVSRGMLMSARGNSGVILSQLFRGINKGFENFEAVDAIRLAQALQRGVEQAYKAVMKPVEGTILTVAKDGAAKMLLIANSMMTINEFFEEYLAELKESLNRTPELLPVLKEAGVVDSGGAGFVTIIEGMLKYLNDEVIDSSKVDNDENKDVEKGYNVILILNPKDNKASSIDTDKLNNELSLLGTEINIIKDDNVIKVHAHSAKPGDVLSKAQEYGEFSNVIIENLEYQHTEIQEVKHVDLGTCPCGEDHKAPIVKPDIRKKYAIVSVGTGEGLCEVFKLLGSDMIVSGGQSMNPSTEDFINAFNQLNADNIIVFPNNKNIVLAAKQAAKIYTDSNVVVIETKSLSQGYSCLTMMDLSLEIDEIVSGMKEVISNVVSAQVTYSVRDTELNGLKICKDDYIGICEGSIVTSRRSRTEAVKDLIRQSNVNEKSSITIIYGKDVNIKEVNTIQRFIEKNYPNLETDVIDGGQDVYSYLFVIE